MKEYNVHKCKMYKKNLTAFISQQELTNHLNHKWNLYGYFSGKVSTLFAEVFFRKGFCKRVLIPLLQFNSYAYINEHCSLSNTLA